VNDISKMLIDAATKVMKNICTKELINESEQGVWASELWGVLKELGMITVAIPEERGGNGGSYTDALDILRLAGKYSAPIPLAETFLGNWMLNQLGGEISEEPLTVAFPKRNETFHFQKRDNGWLVSGKATSVPWARFAKQILIFGQTEFGHVMALIKQEDGKIELVPNIAGEARDTVKLDNTFITDCQIIPIEFEHTVDQLRHNGALTRIVMMAGALERILELTQVYTTERVQFGRPIHRFQAIQQQLAILAGEYVAAGMAADCAVDAFEPGSLSRETAMAKIRINEAAGKAAAIAHQVHGAIGFTHEHVLHQSTRRLWAWRDEYGTETEWGNELARQMLENGQDGLWSFLTAKQPTGLIMKKESALNE
jgi:acyl-CoA dehydrogenase